MIKQINFKEFCNEAKIDKQSKKLDIVVLFVYYHLILLEKDCISVSEINSYFETTNLSTYNSTYLKRDLSKDRRIIKILKSENYKLTYQAIRALNKQFLHLKDKELEIKTRVNISSTPLLNEVDLIGAQKMAQLYIILHCWENSVRNFISKTLYNSIGIDWWSKTTNSDLEKKLNERKSKEVKQKWISPRGTENPLFYLDWGDLVKIIRKHETFFKNEIPDIKFVELRLDELERLRNIIAHNGLVPDDNDIDRIIVHFNDWCSQLKR